MEKFLIFLAAAALAVNTCIAIPCDDTAKPRWPRAYSVHGVITVPSALIEEPFVGYYNQKIGKSRTDHYNGTTKTYQFSHTGEYGRMYKLIPVSNDTQLNVITCFYEDGTKKSPVVEQTLLPSISQFSCVGEETVEGVDAQKWVYTEMHVDSGYHKNIWWITWRKTSDVNESKVEPVPVRYETSYNHRGISSGYQSHSFTNYISEPPPNSVFDLKNSKACQHIGSDDQRSIGFLNPMKEYVENYDDHIEQAWRDFVKEHNKEYRTSIEYSYRRRIFRDKHRFIHSTNRAGLGYQLALNSFSDWTEDELKTLRGRKPSFHKSGASPFPYTEAEIEKLSNTIVPGEHNWHLLGAVTPVKNQWDCGSCWAFGTTGSLEGAYFLKTGSLVSFSEQALMDCTWEVDNAGCFGGSELRSFEWIKKHGGLPLETDYPYLGDEDYCHINKTKLVAPIEDVVSVTPKSEDALRLAIFKHGPVSVSINAAPGTFTYYSNGIYSDPECLGDDRYLDHAVVAIGYGELEGRRYWLIKNSWSVNWGNDGYILIAAKDNICGVMTTPTYVTM